MSATRLQLQVVQRLTGGIFRFFIESSHLILHTTVLLRLKCTKLKVLISGSRLSQVYTSQRDSEEDHRIEQRATVVIQQQTSRTRSVQQ